MWLGAAGGGLNSEALLGYRWGPKMGGAGALGAPHRAGRLGAYGRESGPLMGNVLAGL